MDTQAVFKAMRLNVRRFEDWFLSYLKARGSGRRTIIVDHERAARKEEHQESAWCYK